MTALHTTRRPARRTMLAGAMAAGLALTLAACGGEDDDTTDTDDGGTTGTNGSDDGGSATDGGDAAPEDLREISVGVLPIADSQPLAAGVAAGIFEAHGLDVEIISGQGGGATLPAVISGELEFAVGNPVSVLLAQGEGIETRIVTGWVGTRDDGEDTFGLIVPADSDVQDAGDISGRAIAANTLLSQPELALRESVRLAGGDPETVELVEIPFQDSLAQVENGSVDGALLVEPFLSQAVEAGYRIVSYPYLESIEGGQPAMISYTSASLAEEDPDLVAAFRAAVEETMELVLEDDQIVRDVLPAEMGIPEQATPGVRFGQFTSEINVGALERMAELMIDYDFTSAEIDVAAMVAE